MIFSELERDRRWTATRALMDQRGLDALVARATPAPDGQGHLRWLSMWAPIAADGAIVFDGEGQELVVNDGAQWSFAAGGSWFDTPLISPGVIAGVCDRLATVAPRRVGLADLAMVPSGWVQAMQESLPGVELVDIGADLLRLRTAKSEEELRYIERSAALASQVWKSIEEIIRVGRTEIEALAVADHHLRREGCDQSFNLVFHTGRGVGLNRQASDRPFAVGDTFMFEISPRLHGYYTQLTSIVTIGPPTDEVAAAFEVGTAARAHAAHLVRPGASADDVAREIENYVREQGQTLSSPSFGHMLGLEIEEPRIGASPYQFAEDSVFVFHPVITTPNHAAILRGDTYQVRPDGLRPLTSLPETITEI